MVLCLALAGCTTNPLHQQWQPQLTSQNSIAELTDVPFYPQKTDQCGPAALATVLSWAGEDVLPDALTEQLFISGRKGSLQIEMLATARRRGYVAYEHTRGLQDLLLQIDHGIPVVVLQNLALSWAPTWHYAVVVGFDANSDEFLLRSGHDRLRRTESREFARTWNFSDQWMMTVHVPGDIPPGATPTDYIRAVSGLERAQQHDAARMSYQAAVEQWPQSYLAWMGLGNSLYQYEQFARAENAYRTAHQLQPEQPAAAHNLAWALIRQGEHQQALPFARMAADASAQPQYQTALEALAEQR